MEGSDGTGSTKLRLKAVRKRKRMTQPELSAAADFPLRTLKAWEAGDQPESVGAAIRLAAALGVSLDELAGVGPPPDRSPELSELALVIQGIATAQSALALELQDVASRLPPPEERPGVDAAGTG